MFAYSMSWNKQAECHLVPPVWESARRQLKLLPPLCTSTNEHESPVSTDFRATNTADVYSANTESMNDEDQLNYESNFQSQI